MDTPQDVISSTRSRMQKSVDSFERELTTIRTGRASPSLVENISVDYYDVPTPIIQIAAISVPEPRTLMIQPWDKSALGDVEKGILRSDLGLTPNNDGTVIRLNIPPLTEERRRDLVKLVGKNVEDSHIALRNIRRDSLELLRSMEKDKSISRDESRRAQDELQMVTDSYIEKINELGKVKEVEVMEV